MTLADTAAATATEAYVVAAAAADAAHAAAAEVDFVAQRMARASVVEPLIASSASEGEAEREPIATEDRCCVACGEMPRDAGLVRHRGAGHKLCYCLACALAERDRGHACPLCRMSFDAIVRKHEADIS